MKKKNEMKIEKKYARGLFDAAHEAGVIEKVQENLHALKEIKNISRIDSPYLNNNQQLELIDILKEKLGLEKHTADFLRLMIQYNALGLLQNVTAQFDDLVLAHKGIEKIVVETVQPLTPRQDEKLVRELKKKLKKDVAVSYILNKNLLGGLILHIGSKEIDDSLQTKLNTLENMMKGLS